MSKNIAVLLSGCGFLDGAEIRESVLTLLALDTLEANVKIYAPEGNTYHVIDHTSQSEASESRSMMVEAARIARCNISPLKDANVDEFDAIILPGGFGVAKNFCDFAFRGSEASVNEEVASFLKSAKQKGKTIGAICISPALLALLFGSEGISVTIGNDVETAGEIEKTGAKHSATKVTEICVDETHKIVTTAAYMYGDAKLHHINEGIQKLVNKVIESC